MRVLSLFSGIGAFEKALTNLGIDHEVVHYCEIDKYASKAYSIIHNVDESLNLGDITRVNIDALPKDIDLLTHGSPCQDFSVAGKGAGAESGSNTRSSLMWNSVEIIRHCRPNVVIWENVKNVVSKKHKHHFDKYLNQLEAMGYTNYYKVLNAKHYGIPQNRERIFVISILGEHDPLIFPEPFDNGLRLKDLLEQEVDEKYYIPQEKVEKLISQVKDGVKGTLPDGDKVQCTHHPRSREHRNVGWGEIMPTLCARDYKDPKCVCHPILTPDKEKTWQNGRRYKNDGEPMFTLTCHDRHGVILQEDQKVCEQRTDEGLRFFKDDVCGTLRTIDGCGDKRVLETNVLKKVHTLKGGKWDKMHQSARRVYDADCIAPTVPTCQGGNIEPKVMVKENNKRGYTVAGIGDSINLENIGSTTRRGRVGKGVANTINTATEQHTLTTEYRIRKLIPLECWRLMGFSDEDFNKVQAAGISNSQLYKMAGNSIVVNVLVEIYKNLYKGSIEDGTIKLCRSARANENKTKRASTSIRRKAVSNYRTSGRQSSIK